MCRKYLLRFGPGAARLELRSNSGRAASGGGGGVMISITAFKQYCIHIIFFRGTLCSSPATALKSLYHIPFNPLDLACQHSPLAAACSLLCSCSSCAKMPVAQRATRPKVSSAPYVAPLATKNNATVASAHPMQLQQEMDHQPTTPTTTATAREPEPDLMLADYNCDADPVTPQNTQARNVLLQRRPPTRNGVPSGPPGLSSSIFHGLASSPPAIITSSNDNSNNVFNPNRDQLSVRPQVDSILKERAAMLEVEKMVVSTFCNSFDTTAQQFTAGYAKKVTQQLMGIFAAACSKTLLTGTSAKASDIGDAATGNKCPQTYASSLSLNPTLPQPKEQKQHHQKQEKTHQPQKQQLDLRVLIRLNPESPSWTKPEIALRTYLSQLLGIPTKRIPRANLTATGWAVHAIDEATQQEIISRQAEWAPQLGACGADKREVWYTYIVHDCPRVISDWEGAALDFDSYFREEVVARTGSEPVTFRPTRHNDDNQLTQTMIVSFRQTISKKWRLFGNSTFARLLDKPRIPKQCEVCWDFHSWRKCSRPQHCMQCGKVGHETANCTSPAQCLNCLQPSPANHKDCPLQPKITRGVVQRLSQAQRKATRVIGARKYKQQNAEFLTERNACLSPSPPARSSPCPPPPAHVVTSSAAVNLAIATVTGMEVDNCSEATRGPPHESLLQQPHSPPDSQPGPLGKKRRTNQPSITHEC